MAYLPPVVARLSFELGDLTAKIDEAKGKIRSLNTTVRIDERVTGNLRSQASDLAKIAREADRINRGMKATASLKLADGTRTWEELIAVDREMARLNGKTARVHVKVDESDLSRFDGFMRKIDGLFSKISGHSFNLPFVNFTANPMGLAAIIGGIAALLPELSGLVGGFAAAGAGAAAFGALALPTIRSVTTAVTNLKTAQANVAKADLLEKVAPSAAHLKALGEATAKLHAAQQAVKDLGPGATQAADGLQTLSQRFHDLASAFKPQALKIFNDFLKIANDLLPTLGPMATAFANALDPLLKRLDSFVQSKGFKKWMDDFTSRIGPAVTAIGNGLAAAGPALGRFLTALSSPGMVNAINIAFTVLTGTINALTATVRFLANAWSGMGLAIDNVKGSLHSIANAFDTARHFLAGAGHDIAQDFDQARHAVATVAHNIASAFDTVRHDIAAKFDGVKGAIVAKFAGAGAWLSGAAHNIANTFDHVRHDIAAWFDGVKGAIVGKFAGAGSWLKSVGSAIIQGLINGLNSMIPGLGSVVGKVIGMLKSVGKAVGVKSPSTLFTYYGQMIGLGLAQGIESQNSRVQVAANGLVGMVTGPAANAAGHVSMASGADQPIHVHVHLDGREITNAVARRSVQTQRRTGTNGMTKRTR